MIVRVNAQVTCKHARMQEVLSRCERVTEGVVGRLVMLVHADCDTVRRVKKARDLHLGELLALLLLVRLAVQLLLALIVQAAEQDVDSLVRLLDDHGRLGEHLLRMGHLRHVVSMLLRWRPVTAIHSALPASLIIA